MAVGLFGLLASGEEDVGQRVRGREDGRGHHIEGFAQPQEAGGAGAEEDGCGGELKWGEREVLDRAGEAGGYEPEGLQAGEGFGEEVGFTFVKDLLFGYGGDGHVVGFDKVVNLFGGDGERVVVVALQHEAPAVSVKGMHHGPVRVA